MVHTIDRHEDGIYDSPISVNIPAFTKFEACPTCHGTGWQREVKGIGRMIQCPTCDGRCKLPMVNADGRFIKYRV